MEEDADMPEFDLIVNAAPDPEAVEASMTAFLDGARGDPRLFLLRVADVYGEAAPRDGDRHLALVAQVADAQRAVEERKKSMITVEIAERCYWEDLAQLPEDVQQSLLANLLVLEWMPGYGTSLNREAGWLRRPHPRAHPHSLPCPRFQRDRFCGHGGVAEGRGTRFACMPRRRA